MVALLDLADLCEYALLLLGTAQLREPLGLCGILLLLLLLVHTGVLLEGFEHLGVHGRISCGNLGCLGGGICIQEGLDVRATEGTLQSWFK